MGRLGRDDPGRLRSEIFQPHRKAALIDRMELHEAGPGLVEKDVIAQMTDPLDDRLGVVDRAVVSALLDHRGAEGALFLPDLLVLDKWIVTDALAQGRLVKVEEARRTDEAIRIAVR